MRKIKLRTLFVFALAAASGAALLHTSQNVQRAQAQKAALEEKIAAERENIQVLGAEWAFLTNPARLEKLADDYLDLQMPRPDLSVTALPDLSAGESIDGPPALAPAAGEAETSPSAGASP